ncbi:Phenylacetate-coenzyme A ligase [Rubripirellula obstinata]|uniref:Phenylacetate-coenzyme A ligase n=1 Tax=Rubripirellula obstinata TaxID=406547 RepID=A0A5B1CKX0_9BACT|nr:phenylacetate--CoA ligase family protein [Rubripirellula obstinata]KAA1259974.1 Phenylacetate-coenzyme A ligase [Rubripirellula obstinata]
MTQHAINVRRNEIHRVQLDKLNRVLSSVKDRPFYRERLQELCLPIVSLEDFSRVPVLTKTDLVSIKINKLAGCFDLPRSEYCRFHQTSGTRGYPMVVTDTADDWRWWLDCWDHVLDAARVTDRDVAMMAFSFGPFIGFWTANDAMVRRGTLVIPGGGMSSETRLSVLIDQQCSVLCCTPTYALYLASVASRSRQDLRQSHVSRIIVAGEPGGSIPSVRARIEEAWDAEVIDHAGGSEIGAWGFGSPDGKGLHVIETEFIAEVINFDNDEIAGVSVADGDVGELVLTNLGRFGGPAIRYRTGDVVKRHRDHDYPSPFAWLDGGVIGRADDMVVVRGVNIFPSSIEAIIREFEPDAEFRITITRSNEMDEVVVELETEQTRAEEVAMSLQKRLTMRIEFVSVAKNSLPRFESKAKRVVDRRELPS